LKTNSWLQHAALTRTTHQLGNYVFIVKKHYQVQREISNFARSFCCLFTPAPHEIIKTKRNYNIPSKLLTKSRKQRQNMLHG